MKDELEITRGAKNKGRPREFETEKALDAALRVFWAKGYEGASLPDLNRAMGINRPSIYAAFGNKEALFRTVVERYARQAGATISAALAQPRIRDALDTLLKMAVGCSKTEKTRGCILVQGALVCGDDATAIKRDLTALRNNTECLLRVRLEHALAAGELRPDTDVRALAKFIVTFQHGIAVQSAGGTPREQLLAAAEIALTAIDPWLAPATAKRRK